MEKKVAITARIDENIVKEFRDFVYKKPGLKRGDITNAIAQALVDYMLNNKDEN